MAVAAIDGVSDTVRTDRARVSSHLPTGRVTLILPCWASQANSYQLIAATASSVDDSSAATAAVLSRSGSADHHCTTWVSISNVLNRTPSPRRW